MPATTEFTKRQVTRDKPVPAYDAWVAVWNNRGRGAVMIGAPTLDLLEARWEQIANSDFDRTIAQRVVITSWHKTDVPPLIEPSPDAVTEKP